MKQSDNPSFKKNKPIISILPGSREQEVDRKLGLMLKAVSKYKDFDMLCCLCS